MEIIVDVGRLLFGGLVLYLGAEWLVKGSAGLARAFGVKPLIIGLTVVAYGTSAPELAVSSAAILDFRSDIVTSNIIGSCIANMGLILGITALMSPPSVDGTLIRREIPVLILSVVVVPLVLWDGRINQLEAGAMLALAIAFTIITLTTAAGDRSLSAEAVEESAEAGGAPGGEGKTRLFAITLIGLALLIGGGELFVDGATGIAQTLDLSDTLIGATVVALGTSLPELAASIVAAMRGYSSLAVGNVIGSNIFNIFLIFGVTGQINPIDGDLGKLQAHLIFLGVVTFLGVFSMRGARKISRVEGILLLSVYVSYIGFTIYSGH